MELSIIIPCYNSSEALAKNLPYLMHFLQDAKLDAEVIVVNDGSTEKVNLAAIVEENNAHFVTYSKNEGKGFAIKQGFKVASGKIIIYTDADIPFEGEAIHTIINYLTLKEFDLAIGDRGLAASNYFSEVSNKRFFGSRIFTFIVGRFITTGITDTQCGLKGFSRSTAEDLFSRSKINGFTFDVELIYISMKRNYDIKKIPVSLRSQDGNSVNVLRHGVQMVFDLIRIKLNHVRGLYKKH